MPHPTIEISGLDYTGKTTQAEMLTFETQAKHVHNFGSFSSYGGSLPIDLDPKELFNWWFEESSFDEMSEALITSYASRAETAAKARQLDLAVVERGQTMLRAQIAANFATRQGVDVEEFFERTDSKVDALGRSPASPTTEILLVTTNSWQSHKDHLARYARTSTKEGAKYSQYQNEFYMLYTANIARALGSYAASRGIEIINVDSPAVDVQNELRNHPALEGVKLPQLFTQDPTILGLAGLSESGKSALAAKLAVEYGFTRLKIGYFNELLRSPNQALANPEVIALNIVHMLATNRHISRATLESMHGPEISAELKLMMGDRWKSVLIEVDEHERMRRLIAQFPDADPTELIAEQKAKDELKLSAGLNSYKDIADIRLLNSSSIDATVEELLKEVEL